MGLFDRIYFEKDAVLGISEETEYQTKDLGQNMLNYKILKDKKVVVYDDGEEPEHKPNLTFDIEALGRYEGALYARRIIVVDGELVFTAPLYGYRTFGPGMYCNPKAKSY